MFRLNKLTTGATLATGLMLAGGTAQTYVQ